jgi:hypothetical protein
MAAHPTGQTALIVLLGLSFTAFVVLSGRSGDAPREAITHASAPPPPGEPITLEAAATTPAVEAQPQTSPPAVTTADVPSPVTSAAANGSRGVAPGCSADAPASTGGRPRPPPPKRTATVIFFLNRFYSFGACLSVGTALHQRYGVKLIGVGFPHGGLKRPERMVKFAKEDIGSMPADELLVVSDCGDTMFVRSPDDLHERFEALVRRQRPHGTLPLKDYVMVSSEKPLWNSSADEVLAFARNATGERIGTWNAFPNTGVFVGYRDAIVKLFVDVFDTNNILRHTNLKVTDIDQYIFTALWKPLNLSRYVLIDHESSIAFSMYIHEPRFAYVQPWLFRRSQLSSCPRGKFKWCTNRYMEVHYPEHVPATGSEPVVIHWNGPSKYRAPRYIRCYHRNLANNDWIYDVDDEKLVINTTQHKLGEYCSPATRARLCANRKCT